MTGACPAGSICNGYAVNSHVGVVRVAQQANNGFAARQERAMQLEFHIFRAGAGQIGVQIDAVGHFGHQRFRESRGPVAVIVFDHCGIGVTTRIRGVVVCAVVVQRPIQRLQIAVRPVGVQIEKIRQAEFAKANFQAPHRQLLEE